MTIFNQYKQVHFPFSFFLLGLLLVIACNEPPKPYDVIIQNGTIVDGIGMPAYHGTIAIHQEKIVKVSKEKIDTSLAVRVIDANGLIVSPGFIDMHTNVEVNIQEYPTAENFIRQGVTTILARLPSHSPKRSKFLSTEHVELLRINIFLLTSML